MWIAVDAMGGDKAPGEIVLGAVEAIKELKDNILLVGKRGEVLRELEKYEYPANRIEIIDAQSVVSMDDHPTVVFKTKKLSSISKCVELVKNKVASAFVSAGNSGAVMAASVMHLKRLTGVARPAIGAVLPTKKSPVVVVDAGANVDCKPGYLLQFGIMGSAYIKNALKVLNPKIGILSNGEEIGKGNELTRKAFDLLADSDLNFIGNVEGREVFQGKCDVLVCDGFSGNILLKSSEGASEAIGYFLKKEMKRRFWYKLGYLLNKPAFKRLNSKINYEYFGGAPLLGIKGIGIIGHGRSKAEAVKNSIKVASELIKNRMNTLIETEIQRYMIKGKSGV
ncbi:MAG: phosphate acyltransferase PlsX [Epsilonproteobacteria bacterium]|nr:phosphate acyltransferase PlsX [Campylobacterota bacterium]